MKYREVLNILKEIEEKSPDMLEQDVRIAKDDCITEMQLAYTLGAGPQLYFLHVYSDEEE